MRVYRAIEVLRARVQNSTSAQTTSRDIGNPEE
jgi:hypothetical protein